MNEFEKQRRLSIIVSDEETGEEVASATGVETMILLVAPDTNRDAEYRRILIGDVDLTVHILFDIFQDIADRLGQGTTLDLTDVMDDRLLLEMTEGLTLH
jgi:hypothetical protein